MFDELVSTTILFWSNLYILCYFSAVVVLPSYFWLHRFRKLNLSFIKVASQPSIQSLPDHRLLVGGLQFMCCPIFSLFGFNCLQRLRLTDSSLLLISQQCLIPDSSLLLISHSLQKKGFRFSCFILFGTFLFVIDWCLGCLNTFSGNEWVSVRTNRTELSKSDAYFFRDVMVVLFEIFPNTTFHVRSPVVSFIDHIKYLWLRKTNSSLLFCIVFNFDQTAKLLPFFTTRTWNANKFNDIDFDVPIPLPVFLSKLCLRSYIIWLIPVGENVND